MYSTGSRIPSTCTVPGTLNLQGSIGSLKKSYDVTDVYECIDKVVLYVYP